MTLSLNTVQRREAALCTFWNGFHAHVAQSTSGLRDLGQKSFNLKPRAEATFQNVAIKTLLALPIFDSSYNGSITIANMLSQKSSLCRSADAMDTVIVAGPDVDVALAFPPPVV
jgi:hypothetical protein